MKNIYGSGHGLTKGSKANGSASTASLDQVYNEMGSKKHTMQNGKRTVNPKLGSLSPSR